MSNTITKIVVRRQYCGCVLLHRPTHWPNVKQVRYEVGLYIRIIQRVSTEAGQFKLNTHTYLDCSLVKRLNRKVTLEKHK